jgi:hypothetical protein
MAALLDQNSLPPLTPPGGGYSTSLSSLKVGDVIASTTTKPIPSGAVRAITDSPISHVMVYVGNGRVVEAAEGNVLVRSVGEALHDASLAAVYRHPGLTPLEAAEIAQHATRMASGMEQDGTADGTRPYDYWGLALRAWRDEPRQPELEQMSDSQFDKALFCSELVARVFELAGIPLTGELATTTDPGELIRSPLLDYSGHLITSPADELGLPELAPVPGEPDKQLRNLPDDAGVPDSAPDLGDDGPAWQPLWHYDGGHLENYWDQGGVPDADPAPDGEGLPDLSLSDGELLASFDLGQVSDDDSLADYDIRAAAACGPADTPWADLAAFSQLGAPGDDWTSLGPGGVSDWLDAYDGGCAMLDAYDGGYDSNATLVASPDVCDYGPA